MRASATIKSYRIKNQQQDSAKIRRPFKFNQRQASEVPLGLQMYDNHKANT